MRSKRMILVLALAIVSGLIAGFSALRVVQQRPAPILAQAPKTQVVVAARDLPIGAMLRKEDLQIMEWPANAVPQGYARSIAEVEGRGVITPVSTYEPILLNKTADKEAGGGLPILVPEGMRAMSVGVDEVVAVAGFVIPGTRVDVLLTINPPGGDGQPVTQVILQNVTALSAGQVYQRDAEGKPMPTGVLTVLVTPEQAERLALASQQGRIQLALRNGLDMDTVVTPGARVASLLDGLPRRPAARAATRSRPVNATQAQPERRVIETYKGGVRTLVTF